MTPMQHEDVQKWLNLSQLQEREIATLRADLARVTAERDAARSLLGLADMAAIAELGQRVLKLEEELPKARSERDVAKALVRDLLGTLTGTSETEKARLWARAKAMGVG